MTPGTILLLIMLAWITVAYYAGWFVFQQRGKRWQQVLIVLIVLWLPLWDVIPGLYLYYKAIREVAGVRIYKTVQADGYLRPCAMCETAWTSLGSEHFRYIETKVEVRDPRPEQSLIPVPGYYEFRLFREDKAECEARALAQNQKKKHFRNLYGFEKACVVSTRRDKPISRYERISGKRREGWGPFRPVGASFNLVRDRETNEVLAEGYSISFVSWLGRRIAVPRWNSSSERPHIPFVVNVENVIRPTESSNQG